MDKKLLDALNNLSESLDLIAQVLSEKDTAQSPTAKALDSGDFVNQIKEINEGVKKIQSDNKKILKNQETILAISKQKSNKTEKISDVGSDPKKESQIKKGVGTILLIAMAVLAIGLAFKLVGKVDFLSVIGLALAITIISIAFEKIAKLKISTKQAFDTSLVLIMIAGAITVSSWILSMVKPIGLGQAITAILIAGVFTVLSYGLKNILGGFKGVNIIDIVKASAFFPIIFLSLSVAITTSSWILSMVKPIGLGQAVTAILIAGVFTVLSYGLKNILGGFNGVNIIDIVEASVFFPIIFLSLSVAIATSSHVLSNVKPIRLSQAVTAILIAGTFVILSIAVSVIADSLSKIGIGKIMALSVIIPIIFVAMSIAIMISSQFLSKTTPVPFMTLLNILVMSVVLAIASVVIGVAAWVLSKIGISAIVEGSIGLIIIATTIMLSSLILGLGSYKTYPGFDWSIGAGLSILLFSIPIVILGIIAMTGIGALAILAGAGMTLLVAATIVGTSYILANGNYTKYPTLDWAMGVGLSLTSFGITMLTLGIIAMTGIGTLAIMAGSSMVLLVAETIVKSADILSKGKFVGGPTKDWAEGVSLALGAFLPVYRMLMENSILSIFGGGVSPKDFTNAIITVSSGIVTAAAFFATAPNIWKNGPTKKWAEGVGTAIGAFAPVYKVLAENTGFFSSGPSVEDMKNAIMTISQGIVDAANFFGVNKAAFDLSKVPTSEWGERVGGAISAFIPALNFISENDGMFSNGTKMLLDGIVAVSKGIVLSSHILSIGKYKNIIPPNWVDGISQNIKSYVDLSKYVTDNYNTPTGGLIGKITSSLFGSNDPMDAVISGLTKLGIAYDKLSKSIGNFGNSINGIDAEKLSTIRAFTSNVILMSFMDPDAFEEMLDKLEEKAGVFTDIISDMNSAAEQGNKKSATGVKTGTTTTSKTDQTQQQMLQILSAMDAKLGTIARNSSTLADYTNELRTGQGVKIKK